MDLQRIPTQPGPRLPPRRSKRKGKWKVFLWLMLLAVLGGAGYKAGQMYLQFDGMLSQITAHASQSPETADEAVDEVVPSGKTQESITLLLLGMDTRKQTGSLNTDVIMVASLNPQNKSATVVSIPRDTYMSPAGFKPGKANSFYAAQYRHDHKPLDPKVKQLFGDYLKVPIDYMVTINFNGFEDVVDALGGITVDVDMDMRYIDKEDGTNINLHKGTRKLTGKQTLDFVRYRHSNTPGVGESSDLERNARQQRVVSAIVSKLKSIDGLRSLGNVFSAVGDNMQADLPKSLIKSMIGTYLGMENDKIQYIHLAGVWKSPYIQIGKEELGEARKALADQLNR
jgi:LCP family protein required for cell wall assembly